MLVLINTTTFSVPNRIYTFIFTPRFSSASCLESFLFIIVAGTIGEVTLTLCDPNLLVQQDVSQQASGVIITPNLRTGSAEFSTGRYPFCSVTLTNIPDYSWCGVHITKLQLSNGERLVIRSGISDEYVKITHENKYYILHPVAGAFNLIQFVFTPASSDVGYKSRSNIELSYQGTCHNFK